MTKSGVLGTLSSFNTLLNNYPTLLSVQLNNNGDLESASFLLDIGHLFGLTEEKLLKWISKLLTDDESRSTTGILNVIEMTIKSALLLHFNSLYDCEYAPTIPDEFLKYSYTNKTDYPQLDGKGVKIKIESIDLFNVLKFCPISEAGSALYFDIKKETVNQPMYLYRSCDMNAWLWWVINYARENNFKYFPWDNRCFYKTDFNGDNGDKNRKDFIDDHAKDSQLYKVKGIGFKKHIISAIYTEIGTTLEDTNTLTVYGCAETYRRTGFLGNNKTISDFNADYIYSLKLFNSKTLTAQVLNALIGVTDSLFSQLSLEYNVLIKKIEKTVEIAISQPEREAKDGYYEFSTEEYNEIVNDATLRYNGQYQSHNENNDIITLDTSELTNALKKIDDAETKDEKENAIAYTVKAIAGVDKESGFDFNTPFVRQKDIIRKFINELVTQIALQALTPKVMLLFAINDYFLNNTKYSTKIDFDNFFKDYWNIIKSLTLKICDIILESLYDLIIGFIRPILVLIIEKLLLETLTYYKDILYSLLQNCIPNINFNFRGNKNFVIENVNYADIIPQKTEPS